MIRLICFLIGHKGDNMFRRAGISSHCTRCKIKMEDSISLRSIYDEILFKLRRPRKTPPEQVPF